MRVRGRVRVRVKVRVGVSGPERTCAPWALSPISSSDMSSSGVRCGCGPSGEDMGSAMARSGGGTGAACGVCSAAALFLFSFCRGWRGTWLGRGRGLGLGFGLAAAVWRRVVNTNPNPSRGWRGHHGTLG